MSNRKTRTIVNRRVVLGSALATAVAGLLGRWRRRRTAAGARAARAQGPAHGKRKPAIWLGHM